MELNLFNTLSLFYLFAASILILFLLTSKTERKLSNILLSVYLLLVIQDNGAQFTTALVYSNYPVLGMIISQTTFLLAPALYLFVKSSVYKDFKLSRNTLLHLLPMGIINLVLLNDYYLPLYINPDTDWIELINTDRVINTIYISLHIQIFTYYFFCFRLLYRYKHLLQENYASPKLDNYKWLQRLITVLFAVDLIATFKNIIRFSEKESLFTVLTFVVSAAAVLIVIWLVLQALKKPEVFIGVDSNIQLIRNINSEDNNKQLPEIIQKLENHMKINEPFMDSSLSIYDLAKQINVPSRELSVAINLHLDKHFFDYVNEYRIKKAMDIFKTTSDEKLTVLEVLYEVGFNSKSSFNTAFKKFTGITPSEFKKKAIDSAA